MKHRLSSKVAKHLAVSSAFILSLSALCPTASAAPAWQSELTSPLAGNFPPLAPTTLDLQLSWNGMIQSGRIRMEFAPPDVNKPGAYVVRASSSSLGAAAMIYPYRGDWWSELNSTHWQPRFFRAVETDKDETVTTTVRHFLDRVESQEITQSLKTEKSQQTDKTFKFAPVFDLFSAMLHIRSQKLNDGDPITLAIHPFDAPYLLRVRVIGREVHNGRPAIRLSLGMRKIDPKTLELRPYKKLKQEATLWLSDDAARIPIELRAAVFIGDVRATLVSQKTMSIQP